MTLAGASVVALLGMPTYGSGLRGDDVVVPERPRLVLGENDSHASTFREPLKHLNEGYRRDDAGLGQCSGMTPEAMPSEPSLVRILCGHLTTRSWLPSEPLSTEDA